VSRWLARQEADTAAAAAPTDPVPATAGEEKPRVATLTMDEVGAGIPLDRVSYGTDMKRVSFMTRDLSAGPKLAGLMQTDKAVRRAELAIDSTVLSLADVRVANVTLHEPSRPEGGGHGHQAEAYFDVTLVAAKASAGGKGPGPEDNWAG
jgi:hypothetical protein